MNLIDFFKRFPDEQSCKDALREQRQMSGIVCRHCKGEDHYWMKSLEHLAIQLMISTKKGFSAKEIQRQLGYKRYEPVWYMMQKIRVAMACRDERYDLSGTLEMDEGFFPSVKQDKKRRDDKPLKRGRGSEKRSPVLVMAETDRGTETRKGRPRRSCKYFRMKVMPDQKSETINEITSQNIHPTAMARKELIWVHIAISNAKRNLLNNFHYVKGTYLQNYLDEFTYKLNRRNFGEGLFDRLVIVCICFSWTLC